MPARSAAVAAGLLFLAVAPLRAAPQVEADPHDLYDRARAQLAEGELEKSVATISRLRGLIANRPEWDPEHDFAGRLLPPLQARLNRLLDVTRKLDDYSVRSLQELRPPGIEKDMSTVRDYTDWASLVIRRLREERDAIVAAALRDPEEEMILTRTESYRKTERLLQVDVLQRLSESAGDDILGLLGGDPQLESVLVRFRQLKRDLMQAVSERDQLQKDARLDRERTEAVLEALLEVVTDGAPAPKGEPGRPAPGVADRFRHFLDDRQQALARGGSLRAVEREALLASIDRYRRYNRVLLAARLGQDETARIEALSNLVSGLPVEAGVPASAPGGSGVPVSIACGLALATALLGWLAMARGRRIRSWQRSGVHAAGIGSREDRDVGDDSKAA